MSDQPKSIDEAMAGFEDATQEHARAVVERDRAMSRVETQHNRLVAARQWLRSLVRKREA